MFQQTPSECLTKVAIMVKVCGFLNMPLTSILVNPFYTDDDVHWNMWRTI